MATFKTISDGNIQTTRNVLNQLVDFVTGDVSGSATRKKYQVFVTGTSAGGNPGVTSSLFQTVYDQNFALQTSNELFDLTVGLFDGSGIVTGSSTGTDSSGKKLFPSNSLMMREKVANYSQMAQILLGDSTARFTAPFSEPAADGTDNIDVALFVPMKRLFVRDGIKRETFAMRFHSSCSAAEPALDGDLSSSGRDNIFFPVPSTTSSQIYTDVGAASAVQVSNQGGAVGNIVDSAATSNPAVGLLFYDYGIAVYDLAKITSGTQKFSGSIQAAYNPGAAVEDPVSPDSHVVMDGNFIPDFIVSASLDQIVDHVATVRFGSASADTFMTFQNNTFINSTLYFCRATADEFNFSSNPTYKDANGKIVVVDESTVQKAFSFVTTVGLYNANEDLLAVAKLSRPVLKNDEKDLTFRVRLDF